MKAFTPLVAIALAVSATATTASAQLLSEDFESGTLGVFTSSGSPGWSASTTRSYTGSYSAHAPDEAYISDLMLTTTSGVEIPAGACAKLSFYHWHEFDYYPLYTGPEDAYDGGVLEISNDNGASWFDAGEYITIGGYNGTLNTLEDGPLDGRDAWVLSSDGWQHVVVDLSAFAGETILIRLREGTGYQVSAAGWYVDDIMMETPPTISVTLNRTMLWPPNHSMANITATVQASGAPGATVELVSLSSNEADNGEDDGNTINDVQLGADDNHWSVRAERSGVGTGRIYTAIYRITNPNGCTAEASATVTVPLSQGQPELTSR